MFSSTAVFFPVPLTVEPPQPATTVTDRTAAATRSALPPERLGRLLGLVRTTLLDSDPALLLWRIVGCAGLDRDLGRSAKTLAVP